MNTSPSARLFGRSLIVIGVLVGSLLLWQAHRGGNGSARIPSPSAGSSRGNNPTIIAPVDMRRDTARAGLQEASPCALPSSNDPHESLGAALSAARHGVERIDPAGDHARGACYFAANPGQQLRAWFSNDGVELASGIATPDGEEPWSLKVKLLEWGQEGAMSRISPGSSIAGGGRRVEMSYHNTTVSQWFENREDGLEQGFTLMQAPAGGAGEVTVLLETEGTLRPLAMAGADGLRFVDAAGADVLRYTGLQAWDANGTLLPARMETRGLAGLALIIADAGASYPITVDPLFANVEARLIERSVAQDFFGCAVALAGDTAVIGAPFEDTLGHADAGCAYVFVRNANKWHLEAKLSADDLAEEDYFGDSVAISGDTVVVGADWADVEGAVNAGKAYVFTRNGTVWTQQTKLIASDAAAEDHFGAAVAVTGDTAVVGAPSADTAGGMDSGCAYVFVRSSGTWEPQKQLNAYDAAEGDGFGSAVAVDGETVVVGAPGDDRGAMENAGSAYVFVRSGTAWNHEHHLLGPIVAAEDGFGCAVAVSGDTVVVGAKGENTLAGVDAGSAHVFLRTGVEWHHQTALLPGNAAAGDAFGSVVALDGDTAVAGAPEHASNGNPGCGSAMVFSRSGGTWSERATLIANDPAPGDSFGAAVAVSGSTALVGVLGDDTEAGMDAGSAMVFVDGGTSWVPQAELLADNSRVEDFFGVSVALSGDTALIGAYADDTPAGVDAGSAYVFVRRGMLWVQEAKLSPNDGAAGDAFGAAVALGGDTAFIGATGDDTPRGVNAGSVSVFARRGIGWVQEQVLMAGDGEAGDRFGCSLAVDGDTALIGASGSNTTAGPDAGQAYVFRLVGGTWQPEAQLLADADTAAAGDGFGGAVALAGNTALVGASRSNTAAGLDAGRAYVFTSNGTTWNPQARLVAPDAAADDRFGAAVALSGDTALVGSPYDSVPGRLQAGSAHVFVRDGVNWKAQAKLTASDAEQGDGFGAAVSLAGDTALIGAPLDNLPSGFDAGSAYVFSRNGTMWLEQLKLTAGVDASAGDAFGTAVALSGNTALVGADADATAGPGAGSAYVYLLGELPVITRQPESKTVIPGQTVAFSVIATGYLPLRYQWRRDGFPLDGADASTYTIQSSQLSDQGSYDCVVSNIGGVTTSAPAVLRVNSLSQFSQTFPGAPPPAEGYVIVTLTPAGVGAWRFVGEQQWRVSKLPVGGLATGDREIEFKPVPDHIQPPRETVSVFSGEATLVQRTYYETPASGTGGLTVVLKPDSITAGSVPVAGRAQWRLLGEDDTAWLDSEATHGGLLPGNYLVECKPVAGRTTPPAAGVLIAEGQTAVLTVTYLSVPALIGLSPTLVPFETVSLDATKPYGFVGQIRSNAGASSGFVVKPRVVATAGHVVFDDGTLAAVAGLQWLHQRHRGTYEPAPKTARGFYIFDGYAAQRTAENTPGSSSPQSQHLDAAAIYFLEDVGRGASSGYFASDLDANEFLLSAADKILAGYPVDGISPTNQGQMYATPPMNATFAKAFGRTFTCMEIHGMGGMSGGPLCIRHDNGIYYPAAIYLGGSGQTVVRAIDSSVIDLFSRAEVSGNGGDNNTGGGITHTSFSSIGISSDPGALKVTIQPAAARDAGAGWKLDPETYFTLSDNRKNGLSAGTYTLQLKTVPGFETPAEQTVTISGGQLREVTFTYTDVNDAPTISAIANRTIAEDETTGPVAFMVYDVDNSQGSLMLSGISSDPGLVPNENIIFDGTGANRSVTVTPAPNRSGTATITVTVSDGSLSASSSFLLTVLAVNDAPTITTIGDQHVAADTATPPLSFTVGDVETEAASLILTRYSSNETLVPVANIVLGGSGVNRTLTIVPATGQLGTATITITVSDGSLSADLVFTLTVTGTALESWRFENFATASNTGSAADGADPDHDGQSNLSEYAAGTNPNSAADVFKVLTTSKDAASYTVTASGKAARTYVLERRASLDGGPWTDIDSAGPLDADGTVTLVDHAPPPNAGFYRIRVTAP